MAKSTLTLVERVAGELAEAFDNRATILVSCRLAHEGMDGIDSGKEATARREELSEATQRALAARYGIVGDDAIAAAAKVPANRPGGIGVSPSAIKQRAAAYGYVIRAGLTPDILNVTAAFRLASITGKGHADYVSKVVEAGVDDESFVEAANRASDELTANRPGKGARPNDGTGEATPLTADAVVAVLAWATANVGTFTDEERESIAGMLPDLSAALA